MTAACLIPSGAVIQTLGSVAEAANHHLFFFRDLRVHEVSPKLQDATSFLCVLCAVVDAFDPLDAVSKRLLDGV